MTPSPPPSAQLRRAAAKERAALERHRARLLERRRELHSALEELERGLAETEQRLDLLDRVAGPEDHDRAEAAPGAEVHPLPTAAARGRELQELHGNAIRETAVRVLAEHPEGAGPIHYKRWFEIVEQAGFTARGRNPVSVFLTAISRSPLVAKTTRAGVYELRLDAVGEMNDRLRRTQQELAVLAADSPGAREERESLLAEIRRLERALDEACRSLPPEPIAPALRVAAS